jgi:LEA14-like dessication related protein
MDWNSRSITGVAIAVVFLVVIPGVIALERPHITAVDSDWGAVTQNRTEIKTQLAITNSRTLELADTFVNVKYTVSLNNVEIDHGRKTDINLSGKQSVISISTWANNNDIPEWWATHINRNQTTTVTVNPTIVTEFAGMTFPVDSRTRTRTVHTSLLAPLRTNETHQFRVFNRTLLIVNETDAYWGHATVERTPLVVSATVTNPLPTPIPVINVGYTIWMNSIRVGHSVAEQRAVISPHSTRTIETRAIIDNSKLDEWWVTHLRQNETTRLTVDFYATIQYRGTKRRVPLDFMTYKRTFHTQIFNPNELTGTDSTRVPVRRSVSTGTNGVWSVCYRYADTK